MDNRYLSLEGEPFVSPLQFDNSLTHEASREYSLPDYMPPIRRVVALRSTALPEGRYVSAAPGGISMEFSGSVSHSLLYTDEEGRLCSASLSADYGSTVNLPPDSDHVRVSTAVESSSCRVLAPRKLNIRTRLKTAVSAIGSVSLEEKSVGVTPADEAAIRRLPVEYRAVRCLHGESKGLRTDGILDTVDRAVKPIACDGDLILREARATDGGVEVRGTVTLECLCVPDGEDARPAMPERRSRTVDFEERIEIPELRSGDLVSAAGRCVSLVVNTDETPGGERELSYELTFDLEADAVRNEILRATADLYSTERETECTHRESATLYGERALMNSFTLSESVPRKESGVPRAADVSASASVERWEAKNGKLQISGTVTFSVVCCGEGMEFTSEDYRIPFRYECDCAAENCLVLCTCHPTAESARFEEGRVTLGAELYLSGTVFGRNTVTTVDSLRLREPYPPKDSACLRAYYPSEGETLWQIAKRYRRPHGEIAEENGLSELDADAPLPPVKKLIV